MLDKVEGDPDSDYINANYVNVSAFLTIFTTYALFEKCCYFIIRIELNFHFIFELVITQLKSIPVFARPLERLGYYLSSLMPSANDLYNITSQ